MADEANIAQLKEQLGDLNIANLQLQAANGELGRKLATAEAALTQLLQERKRQEKNEH